MLNLYRELEGEASLNTIIDILYCKILEDERINFFFSSTSTDFDGVNIKEQIEKQRAFMHMMLGEGNAYKGKNLVEAHAPLVAKGLNDGHFDIVMQHMADALKEVNVRESTTEKILAELEGHRDKVLCRPDTAP